MFRLLFILFLIVPIIEIFILIEVGKVIGAWYTILLIIVTAVLGAAHLRQQGLSTLYRVQKNLDEGRLPATELVEGLMLLIAGALLLTPGFFTDTVGFLVLIPSIRQKIASYLLMHVLKDKIVVRQSDNGHVIEGEHWEHK